MSCLDRVWYLRSNAFVSSREVGRVKGVLREASFLSIEVERSMRLRRLEAYDLSIFVAVMISCVSLHHGRRYGVLHLDSASNIPLVIKSSRWLAASGV